jgi:hypothetical protein
MSDPTAYVRHLDSSVSRYYPMAELPRRLSAEMEGSMDRARRAAAAARHSPSPSQYRSIVFPEHHTIFATRSPPLPPPPPPVLVSPPRLSNDVPCSRLLPLHSPIRRRKPSPLISVSPSPPRAGGPAVFTQSFASVSHLHASSGGIVGSPPPPPLTSTGRRRAISPRAAEDHIANI